MNNFNFLGYRQVKAVVNGTETEVIVNNNATTTMDLLIVATHQTKNSIGRDWRVRDLNDNEYVVGQGNLLPKNIDTFIISLPAGIGA